MRLVTKAFLAILALCLLSLFVQAQTLRPPNDPRNIAPTVGTGGTPGGPTGLFTIYDGQTLKRGEFTFSIAYSNFDRDPGNVDITEVPISFQVGLNDHLELFFNTDAYRGVKVNQPENLSSFYLPNSQFNFFPAIVMGPSGTTPGPLSGLPVFRPAGSQSFVQYPFVGGTGPFFGPNTGTLFGFPASTIPPLGTPRPGGGNFGAAGFFPGMGSSVGSILPGVVLSTGILPGSNPAITVPLNFTVEPTYLPDAPFVNRLYGQSSFGTFSVGAKLTFTSPNNPVVVGVVPFYRFYGDHGTDFGGFNQLQRGASPGGSIGDFGLIGFIDGRLSRHVNVAGNFGYILNSNPKGDFPGTPGTVSILDRPNEIVAGVGFDFPINRYFQPITELRLDHYTGGTPNAFQNNPIDFLIGARIYPKRWFGFSGSFRWHLNQQEEQPTGQAAANVAIPPPVATPTPTPFPDVPNGAPNAPAAVAPQATSILVTSSNSRGGFGASEDPYGFLFQFFIGKRNAAPPPPVNRPPVISSVTLSDSSVTLPCPAGTRSTSCNDRSTVAVSTRASDPENDPFTYTYSVTGGRVVGSGANVNWDLSGLAPGTYTITTSVADGCTACSKPDVETVAVKACSDCRPICSCPTLSVSGPAGIPRPGEPVVFTATSSGNVTFNWAVSAGKISSGQGTSSITVDTTGLAGGYSITATVEISSPDMCADCPRTASETITGEPNIQPTLVDEYGRAKDDDIKARIDGYYTQLNNDPSSHGYVIVYGTPAQIKAAKAQINKAVTFRKYDASRLTIVEGPPMGTEVHVKLYLVPAGADNPTP